MASKNNPYKKAETAPRVPPTRPQREEPPVVEETIPPVVEQPEEVPAPKPSANLLADMIEKKEVGKACGFYLSPSSIKKLNKAAKHLGCSKSKALDLLIQKYL